MKFATALVIKSLKVPASFQHTPAFSSTLPPPSSTLQHLPSPSPTPSSTLHTFRHPPPPCSTLGEDESCSGTSTLTACDCQGLMFAVGQKDAGQVWLEMRNMFMKEEGESQHARGRSGFRDQALELQFLRSRGGAADARRGLGGPCRALPGLGRASVVGQGGICARYGSVIWSRRGQGERECHDKHKEREQQIRWWWGPMSVPGGGS